MKKKDIISNPGFTAKWVDLKNCFKFKLRKEEPSVIVIHETAGMTMDGAKRTMVKNGLGCHFIIDTCPKYAEYADIYECVNPLFYTSHAKGMNDIGIGIEFVNPYCSDLIPLSKCKKYECIDPQWWTWKNSMGSKYVLPFQGQIESGLLLVKYLIDEYGIEVKFPSIGIREKIPCSDIKSGIVAHRDFGKHADGRYILESIYDRFKMEGLVK
jgi:hypothetical protein